MMHLKLTFAALVLNKAVYKRNREPLEEDLTVNSQKSKTSVTVRTMNFAVIVISQPICTIWRLVTVKLMTPLDVLAVSKKNFALAIQP
jgi:hypothetical protein